MIFKKILLAVDLSEIDDTLVNYLKSFTEIFQPDEVHIVNVIIPLFLPLNMEDEVLENTRNAEDLKFKDLIQKIKKRINGSGSLHFHQLSGNPMSEILKFSHENKIDLIVAGRKRKSHGGIVPERLSRKANCSVLLVPKDAKPSFKRIAVPIDFSEHSKLALRTVKNYSGDLTGSTIYCIDVLYSPAFPSGSGNTEKLFKEDKSKTAESKFKKFISRYEDESYVMKTYFAFDDHNNPYHHIIRFAETKKADLIIIGSKGLSAAATIFLGSTAEKVIRHNFSIPVLVVKRKDENIGLFKLWFG